MCHCDAVVKELLARAGKLGSTPGDAVFSFLYRFFLCLEGDMGGYGIAVVSFFSSGISVILILMCGIAVSSSPAVYGFSPFWLTVFGKRRSFTVLRYHSFVLSCLIQVNTICSKNHCKLNRLIKVKYFRLNGNDRAFQSL